VKNLRALIILYIANTISGIAQGISMLAIPWYFARTEDMAIFGIIFLVTHCLSLIWMPYAGILVDRYNRKGILLAMTVTGFIIIGASAVAGFMSGMHMWIVAVAFMYTFFHFNIHYTNLYAFVQEIIEERHYARITSVMEVIHQLTTMLAGAVGAILLEGTLDGRWNLFGVHIQTPWTLVPWGLEEIFALDAQVCPGGSWPPPLASGVLPKLLVFILSRKKSPKSFMAFGLRLVLIFCKTKNRQKKNNN
jgi:MFS family permease